MRFSMIEVFQDSHIIYSMTLQLFDAHHWKIAQQIIHSNNSFAA